jgi:hypothetical protein
MFLSFCYSTPEHYESATQEHALRFVRRTWASCLEKTAFGDGRARKHKIALRKSEGPRRSTSGNDQSTMSAPTPTIHSRSAPPSPATPHLRRATCAASTLGESSQRPQSPLSASSRRAALLALVLAASPARPAAADFSFSIRTDATIVYLTAGHDFSDSSIRPHFL